MLDKLSDFCDKVFNLFSEPWFLFLWCVLGGLLLGLFSLLKAGGII